jgi:hypothetical protein
MHVWWLRRGGLEGWHLGRDNIVLTWLLFLHLQILKPAEKKQKFGRRN